MLTGQRSRCDKSTSQTVMCRERRCQRVACLQAPMNTGPMPERLAQRWPGTVPMLQYKILAVIANTPPNPLSPSSPTPLPPCPTWLDRGTGLWTSGQHSRVDVCGWSAKSNGSSCSFYKWAATAFWLCKPGRLRDDWPFRYGSGPRHHITTDPLGTEAVPDMIDILPCQIQTVQEILNLDHPVSPGYITGRQN